jgi:hypothetical protein
MRSTVLKTFALLCLVSGVGVAQAQTLDPLFAGSYSLLNLGGPSGIPASLGGLTLKAGDNNRLLIGGAANGATGAIYDIGVTRDGGGHINGFSGSGVNFASAPNIDGGLAYGPGGVLFATTYNNNNLLQYKPGSNAPDKIINLSSLGIAASTGTIQFTTTGAVIASYNASIFYSIGLTPDGLGTFDLTVGSSVTTSGGPEGIIYVPTGSAIFSALNPTANWMLVSEYSAGRVSAYESDSNGLPIGATRRDFITGLTGAEGAAQDPTNNDFLFSTFGGGNRVISVRGFATPPTTSAPEPGTLALVALGMALPLVRRRRK